MSDHAEVYMRAVYDDAVRQYPLMSKITWAQYRAANRRHVLANMRRGSMVKHRDTLRWA